MPADEIWKLGCLTSMKMMGFQNERPWQVLILRDKLDIIIAHGIKIRVAIKVPWPTWIYGDFRGKIDGDLTRALFHLYNKKLRAGKLT